jgi:Transcriptional activator of acetoin/glycerol metabolism
MDDTSRSTTHTLDPDTRAGRLEGCSCRRARPTVQKIAKARVSFLVDEQVDQHEVRAPILASWKRAKEWRLQADRIELPFNSVKAADSPLMKAATPVVHEAADQLASEPVSVILCDSDGVVLERRTGDSALHKHLDKVWLAPGFSYAEKVVGTNGIGTALQDRGPARVFGHEHYAEDLADLACVGYPIRHPASGKLLGVIDLTSWRRDANSLMVTTVLNMARRIEQRLLDQMGRRELALLHEYLTACERNRSAVFALGDDLLMMNDQARNLLEPGDQPPLLAEAAEALRSGHRRQLVVDLPSGATARIHCLSSLTDVGVRSGVLKVSLVAEHARPSPSTGTSPASGRCGSVGSGALWTKCSEAVDRLAHAGEWLMLEGEPGTGKTALAVASHRRHTPTARLRVLDAADHGPGWIAEIVDELEAGNGTLVLRHLERLDDEGVQSLADALEPHRESTDVGRLRVIVTVTCGRARSHSRLSPLLTALPHTVEVPPLRHHVEDVAELVPHLVARLAHGTSLTFSADAMRLLMRNHWPGNVEQLRRVLTKIVSKRRTGEVTLADLPPECRSSTRRLLTLVETIECDAIVEALLDKRETRPRRPSTWECPAQPSIARSVTTAS